MKSLLPVIDQNIEDFSYLAECYGAPKGSISNSFDLLNFDPQDEVKNVYAENMKVFVESYSGQEFLNADGPTVWGMLKDTANAAATDALEKVKKSFKSESVSTGGLPNVEPETPGKPTPPPAAGGMPSSLFYIAAGVLIVIVVLIILNRNANKK